MKIAYMWQKLKDGRYQIRRVNTENPESTDGFLKPGRGLYARAKQDACRYLERNGNPVFGVDPVPTEIMEVWSDGQD